MVDPAPSLPLPPGSTIGILGCGQLGRMLALAAARLGLKTHVYCDTPGPSFDVASAATRAAFDDEAALAAFARAVDVVTYEFENVHVETARILARHVPVRPSARALEVAQDRLVEKAFIAGLSIPLAPFAGVDSPDDLRAALARIGAPAILKSRRLGYDGKGQASLATASDVDSAWAAIGGASGVLEQRIAFHCEISALVVRGHDGRSACYDCPRNHHEGGILRHSIVPAGLLEADLAAARAIAGRIAEALDYVGVLAVEMFHLGPDAPEGARLLVNEIAPRVHNSGHWTIDSCTVSQFENHIRAVAGWPLGSTARHSDAEMTNLIGAEVEAWPQLAAEPGACLHLYGKRDAHPGRKMGHVTRLRKAMAG
ncbi:MAG TPA: 5-(carboxyamino)imidazole ribonucleotide synthase [Hyphomicrobiaceae bacterium]|nr:5-(carboxyamino)imidazole ribonucleotide synthase [Hyphomicrobiaceae bacterium]